MKKRENMRDEDDGRKNDRVKSVVEVENRCQT